MDDSETPVRVHSALALAEMLRHTYGKMDIHYGFPYSNAMYSVKDAVKQIIGHVIESECSARSQRSDN